jgi:FkbM family methyltransferase
MSIWIHCRRAIKRFLNSCGFNRLLHTVLFSANTGSIASYRGCRFQCSHRNGYEIQLLQNAYNEDAVIGQLIPLAKGCRGLFLDIGANIGVFSLAMAKATPCSVLAFEPEPINYLKFQRNIALNPGLDIRAFNLACSDKEGEYLDFTVPFGRNRGHPFVGKMTEAPLFSWELRVPSCSLDRLWDDLGRPPVAGFKIDVEGYEESVLLGMGNILSQDHSMYGLVELHPHFRQVDCDGIQRLLKKFGFQIREITREGLLLPAPSADRHDGHALCVTKTV